jgi:ribosomal protein L3 glutamine methyltransferase
MSNKEQHLSSAHDHHHDHKHGHDHDHADDGTPPDYFEEAYEVLLTVRDMIRFAVSRFNEAQLFFGHGSQSAYDEAAYLVLRTLHLPIDTLEPFMDSSLTDTERVNVIKVLERRVKERIPAAYLTGEAYLGEHRFIVDDRVIVPRSFIAEMLPDALAPWIADPEHVLSICDVCTGSGCLAILAALYFPHAQVAAVDLSEDALAVATLNVENYNLSEQITLHKGDLLAPFALGSVGSVGNASNATAQIMHATRSVAKFDLIISNPPYVTAESMAALPPEYLAEPQMALASGEDGLDHVRQLLRDAPQHLNKNGLLVVEVGFNRENVEAAFPDLPLTWPETSAGDGVVFIVSREQLLG